MYITCSALKYPFCIFYTTEMFDFFLYAILYKLSITAAELINMKVHAIITWLICVIIIYLSPLKQEGVEEEQKFRYLLSVKKRWLNVISDHCVRFDKHNVRRSVMLTECTHLNSMFNIFPRTINDKTVVLISSFLHG